jgi:transposase
MPPPLYWLSDDAWAAIEPRLPKQRPGPRRMDDRMVISGIIHMLLCGTPWDSCPLYYGVARTVYQRWRKWNRRGVWTNILAALTDAEWASETARINADYIAYYNDIQKAGNARGRLALDARVVNFHRRRSTSGAKESG